ncbi:MAG: type I methionyl aminopeptidase [Candidatus Bipolaricaulota bacterium]
MIVLKSVAEISAMRENGRLLAEILERLVEEVRPGRTTAWFNERADEWIRACGGESAFDRLAGFPGVINASLNEEIVHGIPSPQRVLREGDLFSIDIGMVRDGFCVDMATTVPVGEVSEDAARLLEVGEQSLREGIKEATIGKRLSDVSHAIGTHIQANGFYVVKEYVGHGIGRALHEDPQIPNYGPPGRGVRLRAGMTLAIEPMLKTDDLPTRVRADGWTVETASGGLAVHFEHTVALMQEGTIVLTQGGEGRRSGDE